MLGTSTSGRCQYCVKSNAQYPQKRAKNEDTVHRKMHSIDINRGLADLFCGNRLNLVSYVFPADGVLVCLDGFGGDINVFKSRAIEEN